MRGGGHTATCSEGGGDTLPRSLAMCDLRYVQSARDDIAHMCIACVLTMSATYCLLGVYSDVGHD